MRTGGTTATKSGNAEIPLLNLYMLGYACFEIGGWMFCSYQQLTTTHDSVIGILLGGILVPSHMTGAELLAFLQGNTDKYNRIAWTIAWVTQIIYWGASVPGSPVNKNVWLHYIILGLFFLLEISTDLWYSVATDTTLGGAITWVFNWGNGGWLVSLMYIAAMSAGSMFLGPRGFQRLGVALAPVFRQQRMSRA